jgi:hypothetical protein
VQGVYNNWLRFQYVRAYRALLRAMIQPLVSWRPLSKPEPGHTLAVACHDRLPEILRPNFELLCKQDLSNLRETVVSFDGPRTHKLAAAAQDMQRRFPQLKLRFLYLDPAQTAMLRLIGWGWVNCWLSYCKCIGAATTRYVLLHDMDAMLLDRDLLERRYRAIREREDHFLGVCWYTYRGLKESDRLLYIVEMALDAVYVRTRFRPIDLFNHVCMLNGKALDLDTMLHAQLATERRSVMPIPEQDWVHPGQVISQYTFLARHGEGYVAPAENNLFFIPYFLHLAGDGSALPRHTRALNASETARVPFLDYEIDLRAMSDVHQRWVRKQMERIEAALAGKTRSEVEDYLRAIERHVVSGLDSAPARAG